ncbi:DUF4873 domain-containing protein [Pimelobacter sp. 30-1]|uniref:DUF4873 domain-containing protein n=1 Tax=Pimelobacter sp. 30-1 TaxID=2004991 RepID=UPI001C0544C2|nr:DUF4873 domain-containing protein [Pimelobacter sp. 30-1]MBU2696177.1 hypothetical protein [Pimelobacter sp. 30-1]
MSTAAVHEPQEAYDGPAVVQVDDVEHEVRVALRGHFQPLDGHFHWYGRIATSPGLAEVASGASVELRTPHGTARGKVSDIDPWGRFRVAGTGTPPF